MDIETGIEIMDIGLCINNTVIISDIHLGYDEAQNKKGILIPRVSFKALLNRLEKALHGKQFSSIILNGDIKHEFGTISPTEWRTIIRFLDFLQQYTKQIIMIEGNHDPLLKYVAAKRKITLVDHVSITDVYITHGDAIPKNPEFAAAKTIIIGHEHPAIALRKHARVEMYKCFLKGVWKRKQLIVMPSCTLLSEGTDVLSTRFLSPFLVDIEDFDVFVVADTTYYFGTIHEIRKCNK